MVNMFILSHQSGSKFCTESKQIQYRISIQVTINHLTQFRLYGLQHSETYATEKNEMVGFPLGPAMF